VTVSTDRILFYTEYVIIKVVKEVRFENPSCVYEICRIVRRSVLDRIQLFFSWEDCVKEAKEKHPDLRSSLDVVRQAEAIKSVTGSDRLPQVTSDLDIGTGKQDPVGRSDFYSYGVTATQLLFDGFKVSYDVRSASEGVRSAEYDYKVTSSDVRFRLKTAFVQLMKAQELVKITEEIVKRRKQNADLVRLRYEAGREHKGSLLTAEANLAQAEFERAQSLRTIRVAQRTLMKEMGREEFAEVAAVGDFEVRSETIERPVMEELAESNPIVLERKARKEAARYDLKSAKVDFFPVIEANAHVGRTDDTWPPDRDEWSAGISLSFPLFEGGRRIAEVSRTTAALDQAEADERSSRDNVIVSLEETWTGYTDAVGSALVQLKFLEAGRERATIARAQYGSGLISFDNWTIIEDDLVRSEKTYLEAKAGALIARAAWLHAQGRTLEDE